MTPRTPRPASRPRARSGAPPASGPRMARESTPPASRPPASTSRPLGSALGRRFVVPEHTLLTEARNMLRAGGQRAPDDRTPEDHARFVAFKTTDGLLQFLNAFKCKVEAGGKWRIVQRPHASEPGRLLFEFVIEEEKP